VAQRQRNLRLFDAFATLYPPHRRSCPRLHRGQTLYQDDNHLSESGAITVLEELLQTHGRLVEVQGKREDGRGEFAPQ
jgi:hypothetical protein